MNRITELLTKDTIAMDLSSDKNGVIDELVNQLDKRQGLSDIAQFKAIHNRESQVQQVLEKELLFRTQSSSKISAIAFERKM